MKPKTSELMKFKRLCRKLNEPKRGCVGLLELLWNETAKNCPEGDVGRFSNEEIAIMCDWEGDPETLIAALVETRWLDEHPTHRLLVHDWQEHAPDFIKGSLLRWGKQFAGQRTNGTMPSSDVEQVPSSPLLSSPLSIDRAADRPAGCYEQIPVTPGLLDEVKADCASIAKVLDGDRRPRPEDRESIIRGVIVAKRVLPSGWLETLTKGMRRMRNRNELQKPYGYFQTSLINACKEIGIDYRRAAAALQIPDEILHPPPVGAAT